ncbi:MAG: endonuclease III, partial [Planctomycetota bacterium]
MAAKGKPGTPTSKSGSMMQDLLKRLARLFPEPACELTFTTPLELLIATILSAQCTDERVNQVTRKLFVKYRTLSDYADAPADALEDDIRSTGFFNNKAKSLRKACAAIRDRFDGEVPRNMKDLVSLPGVARKTANVVLGTAFHIASGIVVDTHVSRVSRRLGLTEETTPEKIETSLMQIVPENEWIDFSHRLILLGRRVCKA